MARIAPSASPRPPRPRVRWFLDGLIVMGAIASVTWALRTFRPDTPPEEAFEFVGRHLRSNDAVCVGVHAKDHPNALADDARLVAALTL